MVFCGKCFFENFRVGRENAAMEVLLEFLLYAPTPIHNSSALFMNQSDVRRYITRTCAQSKSFGRPTNLIFNTKFDPFYVNPSISLESKLDQGGRNRETLSSVNGLTEMVCLFVLAAHSPQTPLASFLPNNFSSLLCFKTRLRSSLVSSD